MGDVPNEAAVLGELARRQAIEADNTDSLLDFVPLSISLYRKTLRESDHRD